MRNQTIEYLEVIVSRRSQLYERLNEAEAELQQAAMCERAAGILITRHDFSRYSLALSGTVPFGETWERSLS